MKILVVTPEIRNTIHRGIYSYTKTTLQVLKRLGHTTGLLTQASYHADTRVILPHVIHSLVYPEDFEWLPARKAWVYSEYSRKAVDVRNTFENFSSEDKWHFFTHVDYFFNSPYFFNMQDFAANLQNQAPRDLAARFASMSKRISGEAEKGVIDMDFVRAAGYQVVMATSPIAIRSKTSQVKIVQTLHDIIPLKYPYVPESPANFFGEIAAAMQFADQIISVSEYTKQSILQLMPELRDRVSVVHQANPIDGCREAASSRDLHKIIIGADNHIARQNYFLYIGAIERRKNIETLLRAFAFVASQTDFRLVIAGSGEEDFIRQIGLDIAVKERGAAVSYVGAISEQRKVHLLSNAFCLVFPSVFEGFGLPLVEAMSVGCPIIASRNSSLPEVGKDAILYLDDPSDIGQLAELMLQLVKQPELAASLREKGLKRSDDFSIDACAERLRDWGRSTKVLP